MLFCSQLGSSGCGPFLTAHKQYYTAIVKSLFCINPASFHFTLFDSPEMLLHSVNITVTVKLTNEEQKQPHTTKQDIWTIIERATFWSILLILRFWIMLHFCASCTRSLPCEWLLCLNYCSLLNAEPKYWNSRHLLTSLPHSLSMWMYMVHRGFSSHHPCSC